MPTERRKHERRGVDLQATYTLADDERHPARISDLSLGGAFVSDVNPPAFGTELTLFIAFPGSTRETKVHATVRWRDPEGVGVQFGMLGARDTYALTEFLAKISKG